MMTSDEPEQSQNETIAENRAQRLLILFSVFVIGACGLMYELIAGAVASYLLGDSVTQYSLVIGVFLASMGLGSYLTQWIRSNLIGVFLRIQLLVGVIGGFSGIATFLAFAHTDSITPIVLGITGLIGTLVGMEIPLVIRLLQQDVALRVNVAHVLAVDYVGALVASISFPFLVMPFLGLTRAALVFGLFNVSVSALGTMLFWKSLARRGPLCFWIVTAAGMLVVGVAVADRTTSWLEDRLYQDDIIFAESTPYQRIVVTRWENDTRLFLNGHLQFSSADEYRYHEALIFPALTAVAQSAEPVRVLLLGGGDGMAIRETMKFDNVVRVDLVDIDSRVVELFRDTDVLSHLNENAFDDDRVNVHFEDAFLFLRDYRGPPFDVIVMDLPDPSGVNTSKLYTRSFFGMALRRLSERGVLVTQASSPFYAREAFWCIGATMDAANGEFSDTFPNVPRRSVVPYHVQVPSFGEWGFIMLSAVEPDSSRWPAAGETRFLTPDVFSAARQFSPDSGPIETGVNELDDPLLVQYHNSGWSKWNQ